MVQRLLFNRIDAKPAAPTIGCQHYLIADALPHKTESALPFIEFAKSRTKPALNAPVRQHHPPATRIMGLRQHGVIASLISFTSSRGLRPNSITIASSVGCGSSKSSNWLCSKV